MPNWDIFHADRLEIERDLGPEAVRSGIASGAIRPDDLARPAGSDEPWIRVGDAGGRIAPEAAGRSPRPAAGSAPGAIGPAGLPPVPTPPGRPDDRTGPGGAGDDDLAELHLPGERPPGDPAGRPPPTFEVDDDEPAIEAEVLDEADLIDDAEEERTVELPPRPSRPGRGERAAGAAAAAGAGAAGAMPPPGLSDPGAPPVVETATPSAVPSLDVPEAFDPLDEDEEAAAFTLADEPAAEPDEIDLTAMVDVAFQLVLFFLVTATTLYFKTLEIPTPDPEDPDAVAQQMRTLDDLLDEYILVEIDPDGRVQVDREPVAVDALTDTLRRVRSDTLRTGMLLMADFATPHRNAVSAIDSANALGLQIAIARPSAPAE